MVSLGIIVAAWFTRLPEWTTWVLLVALAVYDLVAVLAPGGPLKLLVELASSRDEELPALVYEARPTTSIPMSVSRNSENNNRGSSFGLLVGGVSDSGSVELQAVNSANFEDCERSPLVGNTDSREIHSLSRSSSGGSESVIVVDEEMSPLVELMGLGDHAHTQQSNHSHNDAEEMNRGIKLGLGDFVFYSVLVGRAAMYDLMTVYACYLAIISGLACTLLLLSVCRRALPALPISIALGVVFYFLTRLLMEPFVVGAATNLVMF